MKWLRRFKQVFSSVSSWLRWRRDANAKRQSVKKNTVNATIQVKYVVNSASAKDAKTAEFFLTIFLMLIYLLIFNSFNMQA